MRSPSRAWIWLLRKEWRELITARSWWVFLLLTGPLVGVSFVSAAQTYAEASGYGGTSLGVGEAFSPLIGVIGPTFSACELAAAFLLPFVAIRVVAGDRQSGAMKLEAQHSLSTFSRMVAKALVLFAGWLIALSAPMIAIMLWRSYGGSVYTPELMSVLCGHLLNAGLTIALGMAAAAVTEHPSTAAIVTLTATVGTWIINFIAAVHGGFWERAAAYTPTAMVAEFQHALVRLDVILIASLLIAAGVVLATIWERIGTGIKRRVFESLALGAIVAIAIFLCTLASKSWDVSENRMNSFSRADEMALRQIGSPLQIQVFLAPEDPRRADLEHQAISKLRRVVRKLRVDYVSETSIGLFEQTNPHYGEIWYSMDGRKVMNRATTPEAVLETIYSLASVTPTPGTGDDVFRGHPLPVPPRGAPFIFYVLWPASVAIIAVLVHRSLR